MSGLWHAAALSADLPPGAVIGTRIADIPIALWRDNGGAVHAWEDRCPHRGMALSLGFVRDDRLTCLYHGWRFDPDGRCRYIPAHPELEVPPTIAVTRFLAVDGGPLILVALQEAEPPARVSAHPVRTVTIDAPQERVRAALKPTESAGPAVRFDADGLPALAAIQPTAPCTTRLHLLAETEADKAPLARWARGFRKRLEP